VSYSANDINLLSGDPLLHLMREKLGLSKSQITLFFVAVSAMAELGFGWLADMLSTSPGVRFADPQFYYFSLVYTFVMTPLLVGSYVWQPEALAKVLQSFDELDVIQTISEKGKQRVKSYQEFLERFQEAMNRRLWVVIALVSTLTFWGIEFLVAWPAEFRVSGGIPFWYDAKWYLVIRLLNLSVALYVLWMIILRQLQAIRHFNRLFQWFGIRVRPLHPDEAGGLGALGGYTVRVSLILVGLGGIAAMFTILIMIIGVNPWIRPDVLGFWAMYIVMTPLSLLLPMLSAHDAMQEAKDARLMGISEEFERTLADLNLARRNNTEALKQINEKLSELRAGYDLIASNSATWPISTRVFRNFSVTASLPLLSGLVSVVVDFALK